MGDGQFGHSLRDRFGRVGQHDAPQVDLVEVYVVQADSDAGDDLQPRRAIEHRRVDYLRTGDEPVLTAQVLAQFVRSYLPPVGVQFEAYIASIEYIQRFGINRTERMGRDENLELIAALFFLGHGLTSQRTCPTKCGLSSVSIRRSLQNRTSSSVPW